MTLRALIRPLVRDPLRLPLERRGGWTPRVLFAAGEKGGWWDPSDFSTLFQDSAGATPVTAVGQPVGKILDKSGWGNHRTQATAGSRPTVQQDGSGFYHLLYDGVDDSMTTASVDFSATNKLTVLAGVTKSVDTGAFTVFLELTANGTTTDGGFNIALPNGAAPNYATFAARGTLSQAARTATAVLYAAPLSAVLSVAYDTSAGTTATQIQPRISGLVPTTSDTAVTTAGNFANAALFFGRRAGTGTAFNGREYQTIIRGATSTAAQIAQAERFVGSRMGIAL